MSPSTSPTSAFPASVSRTSDPPSASLLPSEAPTTQSSVPHPRKPQTLPQNWPPDLPYLTRPQASPSLLSSPHLTTLNQPSRATSSLPKLSLASLPPSPNPSIAILPLTSPSHPSYPQSGLFATTSLAPGTLITHYTGRLHLDDPLDTHPSSSYDLSLDRAIGPGISIDAADGGNEARFINDYRGVRDRPNAEFGDMWVRLAKGKWERWMGVWVVGVGKKGGGKGGIKRGEEVVVNYGKGFWAARKGDGGGDEVDAEGEGEVEQTG